MMTSYHYKCMKLLLELFSFFPYCLFFFSQTVSGLLPLAIMWGFGKLDLPKDDPVVIWSIRGLYLVSQLIYFGLVFFLESKIKAQQEKNNKLLIYVAKAPQASPFDAAAQAENAPKTEPYQYKVQHEYEYDLEQIQGMKSYSGILITLGLHFYFGFLPALVIQTFSAPLRFFESKVTRFYLFGAELERPTPPAPSMFANFLGSKSEQELMDEWDAEQTKKGRRPTSKESLLQLTANPAAKTSAAKKATTANNKKQKKKQVSSSSSSSDSDDSSDEETEKKTVVNKRAGPDNVD